MDHGATEIHMQSVLASIHQEEIIKETPGNKNTQN